MRLYVKDFDSNGSIDPVMTSYMQGEEYPFATKDVLTKQLIYLKKKFTSYGAFAGTTLQKLFTPEQLKGAVVRKAVEFRSMYFENKGNLEFNKVSLPTDANFSPIMSILSKDVNKDKLKDIVVGGNFYGFTPGMGIQDASYGLVLINRGNNEFEPMDYRESGLMIEGQVRDMDWIKLVNYREAVLIARNNESAILLRIR